MTTSERPTITATDPSAADLRAWSPGVVVAAPVGAIAMGPAIGLFELLASLGARIGVFPGSQHRAFAGIHVRIDDGDWLDAAQPSDLTNETWRQWTHPWDSAAGPGGRAVRCGALDRTGTVRDRPTAGGDAGRDCRGGIPEPPLCWPSGRGNRGQNRCS